MLELGILYSLDKRLISAWANYQ